MRIHLFALVLGLHCLSLPGVKASLFAIPECPGLSPAGRDLVYYYEVGGRSAYSPRLEWPEGASGVTGGIGYDFGYNSRNGIAHDWRALPASQVARLQEMSGITGLRAKSRLAEVRDILIAWGLAEQVFDEVTVAKFWQLCQRTWPGFDELTPNAQSALWSLTYNRGNSLAGPGRAEMRTIARLTARKDYAGIAAQIRAMKRLWRGKGLDGLLRRRDAEADLVQKPP